MEKTTMNEDVFPIEHGDFPSSLLMETILHHLECIKNPVYNRITYQLVQDIFTSTVLFRPPFLNDGILGHTGILPLKFRSSDYFLGGAAKLHQG